MTRAIRQLWEERERFLKYDRGWDENDTRDRLAGIGDEVRDAVESEISEGAKRSDDNRKRESDDEDVQSRLDAVEDFYVSFPVLDIENSSQYTNKLFHRAKQCRICSLLSSFS
jgi:hypothetical protein